MSKLVRRAHPFAEAIAISVITVIAALTIPLAILYTTV
jgi:hypothetical protein